MTDSSLKIFKQDFKEGPNYFEQKTLTFNSKTFGNTTDNIVIDDDNIVITNMTLRIKLPSLITTPSDPKTGYRSWVNNIGHALIESLTFEINGEKLFDNTFPYGLWLDIYNELNDPDMLEWDLIGKNASNQSLRKYQTKPKIIYVPLHLWFSKNLESGFPLFLLDNKEISISLKIRNFSELYIDSGHNGAVTGLSEVEDIELILDYIDVTESSIDRNLLQNYSLNYKYYKHISKLFDSTLNVRFPSSKISQFWFVNRHQYRLGTTSKLINDNYKSTNGNDIFNYGNNNEITNLGTIDTFETLTVTKPGDSGPTSGNDKTFDSLYYRKVANLFSNKVVPKKNVYSIPFNYNNISSYKTGSVTSTDGDYTLDFEGDQAINFKMDLFAETYRQITIQNGVLAFDGIAAAESEVIDAAIPITNKYITLILYIDDTDAAFQGIPSFMKNRCSNTGFCKRQKVKKDNLMFDTIPSNKTENCVTLEDDDDSKGGIQTREFLYYPYLTLKIEQEGKITENNKTKIKIVTDIDDIKQDVNIDQSSISENSDGVSVITDNNIKTAFKNLYKNIYDEHNNVQSYKIYRNYCRKENIVDKIKQNIDVQQNNDIDLSKLQISYINNINLDNIENWKNTTLGTSQRNVLLKNLFETKELELDTYNNSIDSLKNLLDQRSQVKFDLKYFYTINKYKLSTI